MAQPEISSSFGLANLPAAFADPAAFTAFCSCSCPAGRRAQRHAGPGDGDTYASTITASNGVAPNDTRSFTLTVNDAPKINSPASTTFTVGASAISGWSI